MRWPSLSLLAASWLFNTVPVAAQTVSGRLLDDDTGAGIQGATVLLLASGRIVDRAVTAADGSFELAVPEPGWYRLRAQRIGYAMATSPPLDLVSSTSLVVEFRLTVVPVPLPPIEIIERQPALRPDPRLLRRGFYERRDAYGRTGSGFGHFFEGKELGHSAFVVADLVRDLPGMRVRATGGRRRTVSCRSPSRLSLYIDGVKFRAGIDEIPFPPSSIVALEVYPGMVGPVEYGGGGCVVAIWTGIREQR